MTFSKDYFTENDIKEINKVSLQENVTIEITNTNSITINQLKDLNLETINILVKGGLDKEKYLKSKDDDDNRRYRNRITYSVEELIGITTEMEKIEQSIPKGLDKLQTTYYIYKTLGENISYDLNYRDHKGQNKHAPSNLKVLTNKKGICAGYSLLFKEMMDRQGIKCDYVRGIADEKIKHAWNIFYIDGEPYPVDLTWDVPKIQNDLPTKFFGSSTEFIKRHVPDKDEKVHDYTNIPCQDEYFQSLLEPKKEMHTNNNENLNMADNQVKHPKDSIIYQRNDKDKTQFLMKNIGGEMLGKNIVFKYVQAELGPNGEIGKTNIIYSENKFDDLEPAYQSSFITHLLEKGRIEKYQRERKGYIGYVDKKNNGIGKFINENMEINTMEEKQQHQRKDGTEFIITKDRVQTLKNVKEYCVYEFTKENGKYEFNHNKIVSEKDLTGVNADKAHVDEKLIRSNIEKSVKTKGGNIDGSKISDKIFWWKAKEKLDSIDKPNILDTAKAPTAASRK